MSDRGTTDTLSKFIRDLGPWTPASSMRSWGSVIIAICSCRAVACDARAGTQSYSSLNGIAAPAPESSATPRISRFS